MKKHKITILTLLFIFINICFGVAQSTMHVANENVIQHEFKDESISIYVDPSYQFLKVINKTDHDIEFITIQSSRGEIKLSAPFSIHKEEIDISNYRNGRYAIVLKQNNKITTKVISIR